MNVPENSAAVKSASAATEDIIIPVMNADFLRSGKVFSRIVPIMGSTSDVRVRSGGMHIQMKIGTNPPQKTAGTDIREAKIIKPTA